MRKGFYALAAAAAIALIAGDNSPTFRKPLLLDVNGKAAHVDVAMGPNGIRGFTAYFQGMKEPVQAVSIAGYGDGQSTEIIVRCGDGNFTIYGRENGGWKPKYFTGGCQVPQNADETVKETEKSVLRNFN
jgi:hypothetical protein